MPAIDYRLVRARRDELDLSNGDLAKKVGTTEGYIINILCGSRSPSRRMSWRLSRALELPIDQIVLGDRTPQGDPSEPPKQPRNEPAGPKRRQAAEEKRTGPKREQHSERVA